MASRTCDALPISSVRYYLLFTIYHSLFMLTYILYSLFILSCVVLVVAVLLQPGKSSAGDLFSGGVSSAAFGPRGTASVLAKITIGAAAAFTLSALTVSRPAVTGTRSVSKSGDIEATPTPLPSPAATETPAPASPAASPTAPATTTASPAK